MNIGLKISQDTYEYKSQHLMRFGWWVAIISFSLLVPFICRWSSHIFIENVSQPLLDAAWRGERPELTNEILAYCHVVPIFGVAVVLIDEVKDVVTVLVMYPVKYICGSLVPFDKQDRESFMNRLQTERMNDLSKAAFFHLMSALDVQGEEIDGVGRMTSSLL